MELKAFAFSLLCPGVMPHQGRCCQSTGAKALHWAPTMPAICPLLMYWAAFLLAVFRMGVDMQTVPTCYQTWHGTVTSSHSWSDPWFAGVRVKKKETFKLVLKQCYVSGRHTWVKSQESELRWSFYFLKRFLWLSIIVQNWKILCRISFNEISVCNVPFILERNLLLLVHQNLYCCSTYYIPKPVGEKMVYTDGMVLSGNMGKH